MRFANPEWLWALLLLPVAYAVFETEMRKRRAILESFIRPPLWKALLPGYDPGARPRKMRVWTAAAALIIVAMARPQWGYREEAVTVSGLDIVVAFDISNSMLVEDVVPSRIKKAKHVVRGLFDRLGGDRAAIVAFAGGNFLASPLTTDIGYLREIVETLEPEMLSSQGTDLGSALETAARALERGAEDLSRRDESSLASKVIVLITDGEDQEGKAKEQAGGLAEAGITLFVIGVGTENGGPVPVRDSSGVLRGFKRSGGGDPVISRLDAKGLRELAAAAGGKYYDASPEENEVDDILATMGSLNRADYSERKHLIYQERYQIPLILAVVLLMFELSIPLRRTAAAALLLVLIAAPGAARADSLEQYLENERGKKAYEEGKVDEARRRFGAAQAREPGNPELLFNQSLVQLQQGETEAAIKGFAEAAEAAAARGDQDLAARALYNLGVSRMKGGDFGGAADAFSRSIRDAESSGDEKLAEAARKKLMRTAQQQQKQQEQKQGEGKEGEKDGQQEQASGQGQDQQGKGGQDEKKDQQGDGGDKNQPKQYSRGNQGQKKFNSKKLSREDAERVMAELSENEKSLKARLSKQQGRQQKTDKDW